MFNFSKSYPEIDFTLEALKDYKNSLYNKSFQMKGYSYKDNYKFSSLLIDLSKVFRRIDTNESEHIKELASDTLDKFFYARDFTGYIIDLFIQYYEYIKNEPSAHKVFNFLRWVRVSTTDGHHIA